jgi:hypothetical protein
MNQSIRLFNWRLWTLMLSLLICGINITLAIHTYLQNDDFFGNIMTILVFLGIVLMQVVSQVYENQMSITPEEFYSASIVKIEYFSQTLTFYLGKLLLLGVVVLILSSQFTQFILNLWNGESLLFALFGILAMLTWLIFQIYNPNKLIIAQ